MSRHIHVTCRECGSVYLDPADATLLMSSRTVAFNHCGIGQETGTIRDPFQILALAVIGCPEADARTVESALAGGRL